MHYCPNCNSNNIQFEDNPHELLVAVSCSDCYYAWDQELDDSPTPQLQKMRVGNNIQVTNNLGEYLLTKNDTPGQKWKLFILEQVGVNSENKKREFIGQFDSPDEIYKFIEQVG